MIRKYRQFLCGFVVGVVTAVPIVALTQGVNDLLVISPTLNNRISVNPNIPSQADLTRSSQLVGYVYGNIPDSKITESSVTQHEAALTITESQISDLGAYRTAEVNDLTAAVTWANVPNANITQASVTQHEGAINHDALTGFVSDEHVAHSGVTLTAGTGLSGGGTIAASRTFDVDLNELTTELSIASGDYVSMVDITDNGSGKITFANFTSTIDHDALTNFVSDEHVAHSGVTLTAGTGLSGGGTIAASRTFDVDLNELTTETTIAAGDFLSMVDITDNGSGKITLANLEAAMSFADVTANETVTGAWTFENQLDIDNGNSLRIHNAGDTDYGNLSHDGTDFNFDFTNTADVNFDGFTDMNLASAGHLVIWNSLDTDFIGINHDGTDANVYFQNTTDMNVIGAGLRIYEGAPGYADSIRISHDGTDVTFAMNGTTDLNITGATAIAAGTVDADFDAITGTSYGGITEANLLDKSATETVSGAWTFSSTSSVIGGVTASNLLDKSAAETITGAYTFESSVDLDNGSTLQVFDSVDTDYLQLDESGSQATISSNTNPIVISAVGSASMSFTATSASVFNGATFRVYDSTAADYVEISNDGTDGIINTDASTSGLRLQDNGTTRIYINGTGISFFGGTPVAKPTVTGSAGGNAALQSLLSALESLGLIVDSST